MADILRCPLHGGRQATAGKSWVRLATCRIFGLEFCSYFCSRASLEFWSIRQLMNKGKYLSMVETDFSKRRRSGLRHQLFVQLNNLIFSHRSLFTSSGKTLANGMNS